MTEQKITERLHSELDKSADKELIDVIVELVPREGGPVSNTSRRKKIALLREAFEREAAPVEALVQELGGEVSDRAWINQTLRARLPKSALSRISELDEVAQVDVPVPLEAESGGR